MPGFTHLQTAQPVTFGHHLLAWFEMLSRDYERLVDCRKRVNRMPLGAAALAGTTYPIDRDLTAELLGFDAVAGNSLDGVSDRDFAIEFCAAARWLMMHLSRFSEELVLWTSRSSVHRPAGSLLHRLLDHAAEEEPGRAGTGARQDRSRSAPDRLLTLMKGQPLAYNKDNQEDKEPLFDASTPCATACAPSPTWCRRSSPGAKSCAKRRGAAFPPPPTWPITWYARACRSATATRSSAMRCGPRKAARVCRPTARRPRWFAGPRISVGRHSHADGRGMT
jgi:hypothetical protein